MRVIELRGGGTACGLWLLKTWFVPQRPSVRTSSSRRSGYARPFRFAKEFGPDQVLRSDKFEPQERSTYSEAHSRPGAATTRTSKLATNIRTRNKLLKRHLPDRQLDAVLSFRGLLSHVLRQER
jgi:hypothetical protein